MKTVTQKMLYRQAIIQYAEKYGVASKLRLHRILI